MTTRTAYTAILMLALALSNSQAEDTDNLLSLAKKLHCAPDQKTAAFELNRLRHWLLLPPGVPVESSSGQAQFLNAATLDRLLDVLYKSSEKYPANKPLVEETVIRWNFCSLVDNNTFYNHQHKSGTTLRKPATGSAINWHGFSAFGLIPGKEHSGRFNYSTPYTTTHITSLADNLHKQRFIDHCIPHPDDEHLYRSKGRNAISRVFIPSQQTQTSIEDNWVDECTVEPIPQLTQVEPLLPEPTPEDTAVTEPVLAESDTTDITVADSSDTTIQALANDNSLTLAAESNQAGMPEPETKQPIEPDAPSLAAATPQAITDAENSTAPMTTVVDVVDNTPVSQAEPVEPIGIPIEITTERDDRAGYTVPTTAVVVTTPANNNAVIPANISSSKGLSGSISLNNQSFNSEGTSLNFSLAYKPIRDSYWFIRTAGNLSLESDPLTYSWGIGYDDWHPGTWAVQLNHWGPLRRGDGLDIDNAVAELSYKFKSDWLSRNNASSSIGLSRPISGKPSLSLGGSWNPYPKWFVRSTLIKPLTEGGLDWSYGFGYTDYSSGTFSIEYNNWGVNSFPETNFKSNGQLSLIYRWAH